MRKTLILLPFLLIFVAAGFAYYKFHQPVFKPVDLKPEYKLSATELFKEFQLVEITANSKYLNHLLQVSGNVKEVKSDVNGEIMVVLVAGNPLSTITCKLAESEIPFANQIQKDEEITLLGTCKGILIDVLLDDCIIN